MISPEERAANLRSCAELFEIGTIDFGDTARKEQAAQASFDPATSPPTIGFELEVPVENVFSQLGLLATSNLEDLSTGIHVKITTLARLKALSYKRTNPDLFKLTIEELEKLSIILPEDTEGFGAFWEFNSHPANHYDTLNEELKLGLASGVIAPGPLPLHVTLGIAAPTQPNNLKSYMANLQCIARAAELVNQRPERIRNGSNDAYSSHAWTYSIGRRPVDHTNVSLPEIRSLEVFTFQPELLKSVQLLGWLAPRGEVDRLEKIIFEHSVSHAVPRDDVCDSDDKYLKSATQRQWHNWADQIEASKDPASQMFDVRAEVLELVDELDAEFQGVIAEDEKIAA